MQKITKDSFLDFCRETFTKRRDFSYKDGGLQIRKKQGTSPTFDIPQIEYLKHYAEEELSILFDEGKRIKNYYTYINDTQIAKIKAWIKKQGKRVFLKDLLTASVALSINMDNPPNHTDIGELEYRAKKSQDKESIEALANKAIDFIKNMPLYKDADYICAPPYNKDKAFDLPTELIKIISLKINKADISKFFVLDNKKESVKDAPESDKWEVWDSAGVKINNDIDIAGKRVIILDDKYQSGTTVHYIAMKLQEKGVSKIYGLYLVKTRGNKDNKTNDKR